MKIGKYIILFLIGGGIYYLLEIMWDGNSHWSMFVLAGGVFILCGMLNEILSWDTPLTLQMVYGAIIATVFEFLTGLVVNVWLKLNVWDYANLRFNVLGQICPQFTILWYLLCGAAIVADDYLRYWLFGEEKPRYKIF